MVELNEILTSKEAIVSYIGMAIGSADAIYNKMFKKSVQFPLGYSVGAGSGILAMTDNTMRSFVMDKAKDISDKVPVDNSAGYLAGSMLGGAAIGGASFAVGYAVTSVVLNKVFGKKEEAKDQDAKSK
jgi:hypothetical protein